MEKQQTFIEAQKLTVEMKAMPIKQLKKEFRELYQLVNGEQPCFSLQDLKRLDALENELNERDYEVEIKTVKKIRIYKGWGE